MKKAVLFGYGNLFKAKINTIVKKYEIVGILDNAVEGKCKNNGYWLYNPRYIYSLEYDRIVITSYSYCEIWIQLKNMGIDKEKIDFAVSFPPYITEFDRLAFGKGGGLKADFDGITYFRKNSGKEYLFKRREELKEIVRISTRDEFRDISNIANLNLLPVSNSWGMERGTAIDRYYIEGFLKMNSDSIRGTVMEVGTDAYTKIYGGNKVDNSIVLDVNGDNENTIKGDFETGVGITENMVDCLICTQVLQYIFDVPKALNNIYKMIRPNGTILITVPGIRSIYSKRDLTWEEFWSFTKTSMERICSVICNENDFQVEAYGNAKIATSYLYGLCMEDLSSDDFKYNDDRFPFLITTKIIKR